MLWALVGLANAGSSLEMVSMSRGRHLSPPRQLCSGDANSDFLELSVSFSACIGAVVGLVSTWLLVMFLFLKVCFVGRPVSNMVVNAKFLKGIDDT
jgi:hypothetical protein